mgnify:CR=1 FL=1
MSAQGSCLSLVQHRQLRREKFLSEMDQVIPWKDMLAASRPHYYDNVVGRPAKDLQMMLKIYFLQQWYNLSDPMMEEEICDKISSVTPSPMRPRSSTSDTSWRSTSCRSSF